MFSKLSQLLLGRLELLAVADRIELVGGGALARLVRLEAAAHWWAASVRPASGLLRAAAIDAADGRALHRFPARGSGAAAVVLAPGAESLFMGTRVLDAATGRAIRTVLDTFLGWVDAGHLLVAHAGQLGVLTVATAAITASSVALTPSSGDAWSTHNTDAGLPGEGSIAGTIGQNTSCRVRAG